MIKQNLKLKIRKLFLGFILGVLVTSGFAFTGRALAVPVCGAGSSAVNICVDIISVESPVWGRNFDVTAEITGNGPINQGEQVRLVWRAEYTGGGTVGNVSTVESDSFTTLTADSSGIVPKQITQNFTGTNPPYLLGAPENRVRIDVIHPEISFVFDREVVNFQSDPNVDEHRLILSALPDLTGLNFELRAFYYPPGETDPQANTQQSVGFEFGDGTSGFGSDAGDYYSVDKTYSPGTYTLVGTVTDVSSGAELATASLLITVSETGTAPPGIFDTLVGGLLSIVNIIIGALAAIIRWVVLAIGSLVVIPILEATLSMTAGDIAGGPILAGWTFVRDVVNMFFILFLIVIGLATMMRIENYNYRKLVVNLILMALLVNFSLLIGRIIIQIADVAQFTFLPVTAQQVTSQGGATSGIDGIKLMYRTFVTAHLTSIFDGFRTFTLDTSGALAGTFTIIFQLLLELGVVLTFAALAVFMVIRTIALWILLVISPLAYALLVLPATASIAKKWWTTFIKYALFAPIIAFFLRLSMIVYSKGFGIIPKTAYFDPAGAPSDLIGFVNSKAVGTGTLSESLALVGVYVMVLAFMWAGLLIAKNMGIYGASGIMNLAEKGMKAPLAAGWFGTKALAGFGAEKLLERAGVDIRPRKWLEGWQRSRDVGRAAREATGAAKALERRSALASPTTFFQRYWHPTGIKRVLRGGERKGRSLLAEADELRGKIKDMDPGDERDKQLTQLRALESKGRELIAPDDYFTQQDFRGAVNEELGNIKTDNWHELVDLFRSAKIEHKPHRAAAIILKLTETFNENELINEMQYTKPMSAEESADGIAHEEGEFFTFSAEGAENFRKQYLEEGFGLGEQMSMRIMNDVSDIAEKSRHYNIMRMYHSDRGLLRAKTREERQDEQGYEMDKMDSRQLLQSGNRLIGYSEVPDDDYDVTHGRTSYIEPVTLAYYLKNYPSIDFRVGRGEMNPSQAMHAALDHNAERILAAAESIEDPTEKKKYEIAMHKLITYGKEKAAESESGEFQSMFTKVHEHFQEQERGTVNWPPRPGEGAPQIEYRGSAPYEHVATVAISKSGKEVVNEQQFKPIQNIVQEFHAGTIDPADVKSNLDGIDGINKQITAILADKIKSATADLSVKLADQEIFGNAPGVDPAKIKNAVRQGIAQGLRDGAKLGSPRMATSIVERVKGAAPDAENIDSIALDIANRTNKKIE